MSEQFTKALRLLKPAEFKRVFDRRQSAHNANFGVYCVKNDLEHPRLGLVISKKVSKKAVVRNRIKRQLRESFRRQQDSLGAVDFVVVAKAPYAKIAFESNASILETVWQKALKRCKR
ncbi:MAG: ribonuclease P protein component [Arenicellales bacterium]